jgi:hypothetical protein
VSWRIKEIKKYRRPQYVFHYRPRGRRDLEWSRDGWETKIIYTRINGPWKVFLYDCDIKLQISTIIRQWHTKPRHWIVNTSPAYSRRSGCFQFGNAPFFNFVFKSPAFHAFCSVDPHRREFHNIRTSALNWCKTVRFPPLLTFLNTMKATAVDI